MKKNLLLLTFLLFSFAGFSQNYSYPGLNPTANDGLFLRNQNTGQIYIVFEGTTRYIPTLATLNGLFKSQGLVVNVTPAVIASYPVGASFTSDNGFIRLATTGQVFLREGTFLRWIASPTVAQIYHFNLDIAVNVNSLSGYTLGFSIQQ